MRNILLHIYFFICGLSCLYAQPFQKTFGDTIHNEQIRFKQLADGSLFIIGQTDIDGDQDYWVSKVDSTFTPQWSKRYRYNTTSDKARDIISYNGGYLVAGARNGTNVASYLKLDGNGNLLQYSEMGSSQDRMFYLTNSLDSNIISYGFLENWAPGSYNRPTVMVMDQNLNIQTKRTWALNSGSNPETFSTEGYSHFLGQFSDSSYVMLASGNTLYSTQRYWRLLFLDKNFNLTTVKGLQALTYADIHIGGCINNDNTIMMCGYTTNYNASGEDFLIGKFSQSGSLLWLKRYGVSTNERAQSIIPDGYGGHYVVGYTSGTASTGQDGVIMRIDSNGNKQWVSYYGGNGNDLLEHSDTLNGYLVASGYSSSFSNNNTTDGWIVMVDSSGTLNDSCYQDYTSQFNEYTVSTSMVTKMYGNQTFNDPITGSLSTNNFSFIDSTQCIACVPPQFSLPNDTLICAYDSLTIFNPDTSYLFNVLWNTNDTINATTIPAGTTAWLKLTNDSSNCSATDTMHIYSQAAPTANLGNDTAFCTGDSILLSIPLVNSSTYSWSTSSSNNNLSVNQPGAYSITITDSIGCINSDTITVSENPLPQFTLGNDSVLCSGNSFYLLPSPIDQSWNFNWNNIFNTQGLYIYQSGTNILEVTDTNNCSFSDTAVYTFNTMPNLQLGNDTVICEGDSITLSAGVSNYNYLWSNGDTSSSIIVSSSGVYSLVIFDSIGCETTDSIEVTVQPLPSFTLGNDTTICPSDDVTFSAPSNYTYQWSTGVSYQSITVSQQGTYSVTISDAYSCSAADTVELNTSSLPNGSIQGNFYACEGGEIELSINANGNAVSWSNGSSDTAAVFSTSQNVYVTLTNADGCSVSDTAALSFYPLPQPNLGNDTSLCANEFTLFPGTFSNYLWSNGSTNNQIEINASGTYSVTVTSALQCSNSDTINITLLPDPVVDLGNDTTICDEETFYLTVSDTTNSTIIWNGEDNATEYVVDEAGRVTVYVLKPGGCSTTDTIDISVIPLPETINLPMDTTICSGLSFPVPIEENSAFSYDWSDNYPHVSRNIGNPGTYCINISNECGLINQCISIDIENCDCVWFIPNTFTPNEDLLNEYFTPIVDCENFFIDFSVFNRWGEEIFRTQTYGEGWDGYHDGIEAQNGVYVWKLHLRTYTQNGNGKIIEETGKVNLMR